LLGGDAAVLVLSGVYVMAEIGLARALAETGDQAGSAAAQDRFLRLRKEAEPVAVLLREARRSVSVAGKRNWPGRELCRASFFEA
jgi:hypothetical protein